MAKKKTPYEVLGVDPKADGEAIKKAHRKKSRETHPDRGGSAEEFREVSTAFAVLIDPAARKRYDETGAEEKPRDVWRQVLATNFMLAVAQLSSEDKTERADLVRVVKERLQAEVGKINKQLKDVRRGLWAVEKTVKRLKDGKGFLLEVLRAEGDSLETQVAVAEETLAEVEKALEYLSDCRFEFDKVEENTYVNGGMWFTVMER